MKIYKAAFQKNQGSILPNPSKRIKSLIKKQIVNRLALAKYQGAKGPTYALAKLASTHWGGFASA